MDKKIKDYKVITAISTDILKVDVLSHLKLGWQPIGGVSVIKTENLAGRNFIQAMVKYES